MVILKKSTDGVATVTLTPLLSLPLWDSIWDALRTSFLEEFFFLLLSVLLSKLLGILFTLHSKEEIDSLFSESPLSKEIGDDRSRSLLFHFFFTSFSSSSFSDDWPSC